MPDMTDDSLLPFDRPTVQRNKVSVAFYGGRISSNGGLVLLREAERRLRLAETLADCIREWRNHLASALTELRAVFRRLRTAFATGYLEGSVPVVLRLVPQPGAIAAAINVAMIVDVVMAVSMTALTMMAMMA